MTLPKSFALALALLAALAPSVSGHGWLSEPPARNAASSPRNGHCPHCGNGGGVCGDGGQWPASSNYLGGQNAGPLRTYTAGEVVEFKVQITAHHRGHMELHVCEEHLGELTRDPEGPGGCLRKWVLQRVAPEETHTDCVANDPRGDCQPLDVLHPERWYLPPGTGEHTMRFRIPEGLQCSSCTLQWRWWTANSCIPAADYGCYFSHLTGLGWDATAWCGAFCGTCSSSLLQANASSQRCGEEFRNCADITVLASGAPTPSPATTPTPATVPPASTTASGILGACFNLQGALCAPVNGRCPAGCFDSGRPGTTVPLPTSSDSCFPNPRCAEANSCMENGEQACAAWEQDGQCPWPICTTPNGPATPTTTPMTTPAPTPAPTTAAPARCVAKPGNNGGATDQYCAQCETGYQWWPCNNPALCEGQGCVMSAMQVSSHSPQAARRKGSPQNHGFLATALIQAGAALDRVTSALKSSEEL